MELLGSDRHYYPLISSVERLALCRYQVDAENSCGSWVSEPFQNRSLPHCRLQKQQLMTTVIISYLHQASVKLFPNHMIEVCGFNVAR